MVISPQNVRTFQRSLLRWFRRHGRDLPWRQTRDPYAILVSEFMLQQTQVVTVIPYYHEWLRRFPDFASLARASENDVLRVWQGLGYYARARNLHATAKAVVDRHRGRFPRSVGKMQQLPGIGKYTAHAIASFAFNQSVPIVEANTTRVLARLFDFRKAIDSVAGRKTLWQYGATLLPKSSARTYNCALIDLGALVCIPREPKCGICPVKKFCLAKNPETLPVRKPRPRTTRLVEKHAFVVCQQKILLEQSSRRWRGMWILPPLKLDGLKPSSSPRRPLYMSVFPFTHHRVTLRVFRRGAREITNKRRRWFPIRSLDSVPIPSPHRRAIKTLIAS
ncbi:MAG: A/G-specific adenine glycosylase [Verrucomicrobia bacterium]|nr:MAG: A/G-specific adenine glycosylase [Verrucomicrobiota bacterium]